MFDNSNQFAMMKVAEQQKRVMRMMEKAHALSGKTGEELAAHWTKNICWYLYTRCREFSPTKAMFGIGAGSIAASHSFRIKELKNGVPVGNERYSDKGKKRIEFTRVRDVMIDRGNHRMFIASGWLNVKKIVSKSGTRLEEGQLRTGRVIVEITGAVFKKVRVQITNMAPYARPFHEQHGIVQAALEDERRDLAEYISRKTHEDIEEILRTT